MHIISYSQLVRRSCFQSCCKWYATPLLTPKHSGHAPLNLHGVLGAELVRDAQCGERAPGVALHHNARAGLTQVGRPLQHRHGDAHL